MPMQIFLKDLPVLSVETDGNCRILDFDHLPFALRKEKVAFPDFYEWASNRTLSIGRTHAKEILNAFRISQTNRFAICKACRGLSLQDAYWIRQDGDAADWSKINLFHNPLSLFVAGLSLSGDTGFIPQPETPPDPIHTPELTTLGVTAKGWFRERDGLYLYKIGKNELAADAILSAARIPHLSYQEAGAAEKEKYLSASRREWVDHVGEVLVKSKLFTSPELSMVTFEEFRTFCGHYGLDAYEQAMKMDPSAYRRMQIADYLLNNSDRHEQNWGFFMENRSGKLVGYCPLFDHDHAFSPRDPIYSQTSVSYVTLKEAALTAMREEPVDLRPVLDLEKPFFLDDEKWTAVLGRVKICNSELL